MPFMGCSFGPRSGLRGSPPNEPGELGIVPRVEPSGRDFLRLAHPPESVGSHWTPPAPVLSTPGIRGQTMTPPAAMAAVVHREDDMPLSRAEHDAMANAIGALAMDAVEQAKSGHPGLPMGAADIATVLYSRFLKFDPADPRWPDRDRFVLSAGHGSMLIYALLHLTGHASMPVE